MERQPGPSDRSRAHTSDWHQLKFASVTCGTAVIVFCIIGVIGIDMLRKVDLREHGNVFTLAGALAMGLLPIIVPGLYSKFPATAQIILGNGLAKGTLTAVLLNILFHHVGKGPVEVPQPTGNAAHAADARPVEGV